jgi:hypothetical protein
MDTAIIAKPGPSGSAYKTYSNFAGFEILAAVTMFWNVSEKLTASIFREELSSQITMNTSATSTVSYLLTY